MSTRAISSKKSCACPPTLRPSRSTDEVDYSSGQAQKRTLAGGRVQSASGCVNNENGVHQAFQRRRIRRIRPPATGRPSAGGTHSLHPSRIPWTDQSRARDESSGRSGDFSREIGQEEDANMLDEVVRKKFRRLAATLNNMSLDRPDEATRREGNMHEDGESSTLELEETEEGIQISERSRRK